MLDHWCVIAATIVTLPTLWCRRHTLPLPHYGYTTKALAFTTLGLSLIGPPGEPAGTLAHEYLYVHNLEDYAGHIALMLGTYYVARRAITTAHGNFSPKHLTHMMQVAVPLLGVIYLATAAQTPSDWRTPADNRAYWLLALLLIAPTYMYAVYANMLVATHPDLPRRQRLLGATAAITYLIGAASCIARPLPVPNSWTYYGLAAMLTGMNTVAWLAWRYTTAPIRNIERLVA